MTRHGTLRHMTRTFLFTCVLLLAALPLHTVATAAPLVQSEQMYAMPGTLEVAQGQSFLTYFVTGDGTKYAIFGATPDVEAEITRLRDGTPGAVAKVWGDLFSQGQTVSRPRDCRDRGAGGGAGRNADASRQQWAAHRRGPFRLCESARSPDQASPVTGPIVRGQRCDLPDETKTRVGCAFAVTMRRDG